MNLGQIIETDDGSLSLTHPIHGESYHSKSGALFEAQSLYIDASNFRNFLNGDKSIAVLDVGLGLGYNALSTVDSWSKSDNAADIEIVSLECEVALIKVLVSSQGDWQKNWPSFWLNWLALFKQESGQKWIASIPHNNGKAKCQWTILGEDFSKRALEYANIFDFIWQDPFSPKHNPDLWTKNWFLQLHKCAKSDATLMTYSVARATRDALTTSGWNWQKISASGKKKSWLKAIKA